MNKENILSNETKSFFALLALCAALAALFVIRTAHAEEDDLGCVSQTHCVLLGFTPHVTDKDEPKHERWDRLKGMAEDFDAVTDDQTEKAWLIQTAKNESHLARYVDLDWPKCREGHDGKCDSGKAFGIVQAHGADRSWSRRELLEYALGIFRRGANYCRTRGTDHWVGGTSLYATGRACSWVDAEKRVEEMWRIRWMLGRAE